MNVRFFVPRVKRVGRIARGESGIPCRMALLIAGAAYGFAAAPGTKSSFCKAVFEANLLAVAGQKY
jgi:hypothetical protein